MQSGLRVHSNGVRFAVRASSPMQTEVQKLEKEFGAQPDVVTLQPVGSPSVQKQSSPDLLMFIRQILSP